MTKKQNKEDDPAWLDLKTIANKFEGLGELFKIANAEEACFTNDSLYGLGRIILELSEELVRIHNSLDDKQVKKRQNRS